MAPAKATTASYLMETVKASLARLNLYKTVSEDGTGFDGEFIWLENACTLVAMAMIGIAFIATTIWYSVTEITQSDSLISPSIEDYRVAYETYKDSIIGNINCHCSHTLIAFGASSGGVIQGIDYALDPICAHWEDNPLDDPSTLALITPSAMSMNTVWSYNEINPSQMWRGCSGISDLNPSLSYNQTLTPWVECRTIHEVTKRLVASLNKDYCRLASEVHLRKTDTFLSEYFLSDAMMRDTAFYEYVVATLDSLALSSTMQFWGFADTTTAAQLESARTLADICRLGTNYCNLDLDNPCMYKNRGSIPPSMATEFRLGPDSANASYYSALYECAENRTLAQMPTWADYSTVGSSTFTGHCCDRSSCESAVKMPCSLNMIALGIRLKTSGYAGLINAINNGMLSGMSDTERKNRISVAADAQSDFSSAGSLPEVRRLTTSAAIEGYQLSINDTQKTMFASYFNVCVPSSCSLVYKSTPNLKNLFIIVSAILGSMFSGGKTCGLVLLLISKLYVSRSSEASARTKVQDVSAAASKNIDVQDVVNMASP